MNSVFKVGDKVFDIRYGWGKVISTNSTASFPIGVKFNENRTAYYNETGKHIHNHLTPLLSFTEYDLVNGGFSQVRQIAVDTLVYVKPSENSPWEIRYFSHFDSRGKLFAFYDQKTSKQTNSSATWAVYSFENPLEK